MKRVYYHCKNCRKTVEITEKNGYICLDCNTPLRDDIKLDTTTILMRNIPMAQSTKMEVSYDDHEDAIKRLRKN